MRITATYKSTIRGKLEGFPTLYRYSDGVPDESSLWKQARTFSTTVKHELAHIKDNDGAPSERYKILHLTSSDISRLLSTTTEWYVPLVQDQARVPLEGITTQLSIHRMLTDTVHLITREPSHQYGQRFDYYWAKIALGEPIVLSDKYIAAVEKATIEHEIKEVVREQKFHIRNCIGKVISEVVKEEMENYMKEHTPDIGATY